MQHAEKSLETGPVIILVGAQNTGEAFLTVEGDPGKLAAVVVQESGREADALPGGDIDAGRVVVRAVEIPDLAGGDQAVLYDTERRR